MKRMLRAVAILGMSSVAVVFLGALRHKFIALEVGAEGIGALGILTSMANVGVVLFGLGLNTSGVRAISATVDDPVGFPRTRAGLLRGATVLAVVGGITIVAAVLVWGLFDPSGAPGLSLALALALGATLAAMLITAAQLALLNGMGRIKVLAVCNSVGAAVGTAVTIGALQLSSQAGLASALAAAPLATLVCSSWFAARTRIRLAPVPFREWWPPLKSMVSLGGMVMFGLIATNATQLGIRLWVEHDQGLAAAGRFQAAWTITALYVGFVLTALAAEYFPRIAKQASDALTLNRSVELQVRFGLILAMPVLLWAIVLAPVALHVLYSAEFESATSLLRWQLVGDVMKIVGWAIAFLLLARTASVAFFLGEIAFNAVYLALVFAIPTGIDLSGLGIAYVGAYTVYVLVLLALSFRETRFRLRFSSMVFVAVCLVLAMATTLAMEVGTTPGTVAGYVGASAVTLICVVALMLMHRDERRATLAAEDAAIALADTLESDTEEDEHAEPADRGSTRG